MSCSVKNCKNSRLNNFKVSFHRYCFSCMRNGKKIVIVDLDNKNDSRVSKEQFVEIMNLIGNPIQQYMQKYICSDHYTEADFITSFNGEKRFLRKGTLPSLKLPKIEERVTVNEYLEKDPLELPQRETEIEVCPPSTIISSSSPERHSSTVSNIHSSPRKTEDNLDLGPAKKIKIFSEALF